MGKNLSRIALFLSMLARLLVSSAQIMLGFDIAWHIGYLEPASALCTYVNGH